MTRVGLSYVMVLGGIQAQTLHDIICSPQEPGSSMTFRVHQKFGSLPEYPDPHTSYLPKVIITTIVDSENLDSGPATIYAGFATSSSC